MGRYTDAFKKEVVTALNDGLAIGEAEEKFEVTPHTMRQWKAKFTDSDVIMTRPDTDLTSENRRLRSILGDLLVDRQLRSI